MEAFFNSVQSVLSAMGASVMLPIIIFVLGLILGAKPGRAFRSGVTIGIAFVGINLVIGLMWGALSNVAQAIVTRTGVHLTAVDVGWPTASAIAFGSSVGTFIIPVALAVNIVMLVIGATRTLNVDVWNFWHFAFLGSVVVVVTHNLALGLAASAVFAAIALFMADWTAGAVQDFFHIPGLSIPHGFSTSAVVPGIFINWVLSKIPVVRDWKADPETIQKRWGVFGEPIIVGLVIGLVLGAVAYLPPTGDKVTWTTEIIKVLQSGINLGAVMLLLPRMVQILMEGLIPISEAARDFMAKRFAGREVYIGLDSAILIGHPAALAASLVLVPITILLAIILPGNRMLPFADLAALPFVVCMLAPICRGNVVRMVIIGTVVAIFGLYFATWMAPIQTAAAVAVPNFQMPAGATEISNIGDGWNVWVVLLLLPAALGGATLEWLALGVALILLAIAIWIFSRNVKGWSVLAGAPAEGEATAATAGSD